MNIDYCVNVGGDRSSQSVYAMGFLVSTRTKKPVKEN